MAFQKGHKIGLGNKWNLGKKMPPRSDEWKKNLSLAHKGKKLSKETRIKIGLAQLGKKLSEKTRQKMSETAKRIGTGKWMKGRKLPYVSEASKKRSGDKHYNWKGGITPINTKIRNSLEYKLWRETVFIRDNYTCVWCNARNGNGKKIILHADHIKSFAFYPELRLALDNGRTLCIDCHRTTETYSNHKKLYGWKIIEQNEEFSSYEEIRDDACVIITIPKDLIEQIKNEEI